MIDTTGLIQELRALLDNCSVVEGLDKAVEYRSNTSRREATVEAIDKIVQSVDDAYRRQALILLLTGTYLVHSQTNAMGASNISVVPDINIRMGLDSQGDSWAYKIDGGGDRYTYYGEFGERVARLREEILNGNLDPILGLNPTLILHGISGLRGELLPAISWDPLKGETYTKFANDPYLKSMRDRDASNEKLARATEESSKVFENIIKTIFTTPNNPYANALVTNDYKVYPVTPTLEDAKKLENIPEDKPISEAERSMAKQPTPLKKAKIIGYVIKEKNQTDKDPNVSAQKNTSEIPVSTPKDHADESDVAIGLPISGTPAGDSEIQLAIPVHSDIGIIGFPMDSEIVSQMRLEKETRGVLVIGVLKNSIAEKAGIRAGTTPAVFRGTNGMLGGDVIVRVEDKSVDNIEDLKDYISHYHISGKQIKFTVLRNGKPIDIDLVY